MSTQYCFVCASDEGVLLDVTADNKQIFREQLETCMFPKESTANELITKVCHKCAFELKQCTSFVKKYKHTCVSTQTIKTHQHHCCLCSEPAPTGYLLDLSKDNAKSNLIDKIHNIFRHDLTDCLKENKLICLSCRYTVDVLLDLNCIFQETPTKLKTIGGGKIDYSKFPKTKTTVVSRKTTITESARITLYSVEDSDTDSSTMARSQTRVTRLRNNKSTTQVRPRLCGKCHNAVESQSDMYRIHKTRLTVCKTCWMNSNEPPTQGTKRRTRQPSTETKLCTVFLKDVLADTGVKNQKLYRVEKDDQGNKVYIITDDSSEGEQKSQKEEASDTEIKAINNTRKQSQKRPARSVKSDSMDSEDKPNKKQKADKSSVTNSNVSALEKVSVTESSTNSIPPSRKRGRPSLNKVNNQKNSQTDDEILNTNSQASVQKVLRGAGRKKKTSWSDAEVNNKDNRKKLKTILKGIPVIASIDLSCETSSNDDVPSKRKKIRFASASPHTIQSDNEKKESKKKESENQDSKKKESQKQENEKREGEKQENEMTESEKQENEKGDSEKKENEESEKEEKERKENVKIMTSSLPSTEEVVQSRAKRGRKIRLVEPDVVPSGTSIVEDTTYVCDECEITFENRLVGLTHKLTHCSQLELKLTRVPIPTITNIEETSRTSDPVESQSEGQSLTEPIKDQSQSQVCEESNMEEDGDRARRDSRKESNESSENENACEITLKDDTNVEESPMEKVDGADDVDATTQMSGKMEVQEEKKGAEDREESEVAEAQEKRKDDTDTQEEKHEAVKTQVKEKDDTETQEKEKDGTETQEKEKDDTETQEKEKDGTETQEKEKDDTETQEKEKDATDTREKDKDIDTQLAIEKENTESQKEKEQGDNNTLAETENTDTVMQRDTEKDADTQKEEKEIAGEKKTGTVIETDKEVDLEEKIERQAEIHNDTNQEHNEENEPSEGTEKKINESNEAEKDEEDIPAIIHLDEKETDIYITKTGIKSKANKIVDSIVLEDDEVTPSKKIEKNGIEEKEVESDIRIIDTDSSEDSVEQDIVNNQKVIEIGDDDDEEEVEITLKDDVPKSEECFKLSDTTQTVVAVEDSDQVVEIEELPKEKTTDSANVAAEVLREVFDLATAEVQKRQTSSEGYENTDNTDTETVENISREIQNSATTAELKASDKDSMN